MPFSTDTLSLSPSPPSLTNNIEAYISPSKGSSFFLEQEILPSLLSSGSGSSNGFVFVHDLHVLQLLVSQSNKKKLFPKMVP